MRTLASLCILAISTWASTAHAINENVALNVYMTAPSYTACEEAVELEATACPDLWSDPQNDAFVWVLLSFYQGVPDGVSELRFGLDHSLSGGWVTCGGVVDDPEPGWPSSGRGNRVVWEDGCYRSDGCTVRFGFLSNPGPPDGEIFITADPRVGEASWINCDGEVAVVPQFALGGDSDLSDGTEPNCLGGYCTILPTPIQTTTWSRLHNLFR